MKRARTIVPPLAADVSSDYFTSTRGSQRLLLYCITIPACRPWDRSRERPVARATARATRCRRYRSSARSPGPACLPRSRWNLPVAFGADANDPPHDRVPRAYRDLGRRRLRRALVLPPPRAARRCHAPPRVGADAARRAGRRRPAPPLRPPSRAAPAALSLRLARAARRACPVALCTRRAPRQARVVRRGYPGGRSARRAGVHDGQLMKSGFFSRMNPTLRGFLIIVLIAGIVVLLQLQTTLVALLLIARIVFVLAIAFFVYLMWRERREEIGQWPL